MSDTRRFRLTPGGQTIAPPLERASQAVVMDWCNFESRRWPELRFVFASANGAHMFSKKTAALMLRQGLRPGVPDIMAPFARGGYIGLAIEMKRKPNKVTDVQETWLHALASFGWRCRVCYSATEAIDILRAYVSGPMTEFA